MAIETTEQDLEQHREIVEFLRKSRVDSGASQRDIGTAMNVAQGNYCRLENGTDGLKLTTIQAWARALGFQLKIEFVPIIETDLENFAALMVDVMGVSE